MKELVLHMKENLNRHYGQNRLIIHLHVSKKCKIIKKEWERVKKELLQFLVLIETMRDQLQIDNHNKAFNNFLNQKEVKDNIKVMIRITMAIKESTPIILKTLVLDKDSPITQLHFVPFLQAKAQLLLIFEETLLQNQAKKLSLHHQWFVKVLLT